MTRASWVRRALLLLAACIVASPSTLLAHGALRSSQPASGARLARVPAELRLTFTEAPVAGFTRITLRSAGGSVPLGALRIDSGVVVIAAIEGLLRDGAYTVGWQVAGADGHPVRGEFSFTILPGAEGLSPPEVGGEAGAAVAAPTQQGPAAEHHAGTATTASSFDAESPLFVAVRALLYAALIGVIGAVAFRQLVLRRVGRSAGAAVGSLAALESASASALVATAARRAATIGMWAARAATVAALLRLVAQSRAMHGAEAFDPALVGAMLTQTVWGWGWIAQLAAAVVAERALAAARARTGDAGRELPRVSTRMADSSVPWTIAAVAAVVLAITPALASHAAAAPRFSGLAMTMDGVHVLAAGAWIGGLFLLLVAGLPAAWSLAREARGPAIARMVIAFSPVALVAAALLGLTGAFAAWLHVGSIGALWQSGYGRMLLLKLSLLAGVATTGLYNWRVVLPRLGTESAGAALTRSARVELAFGVLVIVATAVLVALPTGPASAP